MSIYSSWRQAVAAVVVAGGMTWSAWGAPPVVKTVPWVPSNPLIPHDTWNGNLVTVKGTSDSEGAGFEYWWDFGDGTSTAIASSVPNKNAIQATHTYVGALGQVFTARLHVRNKTTGETGNKEYYVKIQEQTLPVEVNVAIDEALWWLWKNAERSGDQFYWRNFTYGSYAGNTTASAVQAFEINGHAETGQPDNPYSEAVKGGLRYLLANLRHQAMSLQNGENPDSNGNGIGLYFNSSYPIYELGAVMDAFVASGTPDAVAEVGITPQVLGRRYQDLVQDMVDMYAWGQVDSGWALGGWRYNWNSESDNSAAQWGAIGMIAAEGHFGCTVPGWVKERNKVWLNYSFNSAGYFGYTGTSPLRALSTGPCGMVQLAFDGLTTADSKWVACENYVAANWNEFINLGRDARYYSYYALTKAMRLAVPAPVQNFASTGLDWYGDNVKGLARLLVNSQNADGYWNYDGWPYVDPRTAAGWNVIILSRTLFASGVPVAVAKANPNPVVVGQIVQLDGSDSFHQDGSKIIDSWEWDLDNNGTYDVSGPFPTVSFPALGDYPIGLRVSDNGSPELFATASVVVKVTTPPIAPTANAGGPYSLCPQGQPWFLDGGGSINPDEGLSEPGQPGDTIVLYEWDLDGDSQYDDAVGAHPDVTAFFEAAGPGSYVIQLRVTDRTATSFPSSGFGDLIDTDSTVVVVRGRTDPECACVDDLTVRAKPGKVQLVWTHTGAHHYNVYRGTVAGGPYLKIGATTSTYSTYLDTAGIVNGSKYYYVVREADHLDRELCQSNEARALVPAVRK